MAAPIHSTVRGWLLIQVVKIIVNEEGLARVSFLFNVLLRNFCSLHLCVNDRRVLLKGFISSFSID